MLKTLFPILVAGCIALTGCGEAPPATYAVSGVVRFAGNPIAEGTVTLEDSSTGVADAYDIQPDGTYIANVPEGTYGVSVQPPMEMVADSANSEGGEEFKKVADIPNRYWSSFESGLQVTVSQDTVFDIDMVKSRR